MDVCRYSLYTDRVTIRGLASVLNEFQELFAEIYRSLKTGGARRTTEKKGKGKGKRKLKSEPVQPPIKLPEFAFGYTFQGSVGFAMTLPTRNDLFADPVLARTTEAIFNIARSSSAEDVSRIAKEIGPSAIEAMHRWANAHVVSGFGAGVEWKRDRAVVDGIQLQYLQMEKLRNNLSQTTIESAISITGALSLVDIDRREFRLRADDGTEYRGLFDTAISEEHRATLPSRYAAQIRQTEKLIPPVGKDEPERLYFLVSLAPPGENHEEQRND